MCWLQEHQTLVGVVLGSLTSAGIALFVQRLNRKNSERRDRQMFADSWRTALEELWHALDRIYGIWDRLKDGNIPNSEILLLPAVSSAFFGRSADPTVTSGVLRIHQFVHQVWWNMSQHQKLREKLGDADSQYRATALWFIKARHHKLVRVLLDSEKQYLDFCKREKLRASVPLDQLRTLLEKDRIADN